MTGPGLVPNCAASVYAYRTSTVRPKLCRSRAPDRKLCRRSEGTLCMSQNLIFGNAEFFSNGPRMSPTGTHHFRRGRYLGSHGRSGPKAGAIDASTKPAKVPIAPGPTTRSLGFIEGPEGGPAAAAYLDGQPGISGRMGEADSAQPTRNGPCHRRLGFGLDPGLISLADGHFYTKSVSVSLGILPRGRVPSGWGRCRSGGLCAEC